MDPLATAADLLRRGETLCLATIIESGAPELPPGTKVLVRRGGALEGSLGAPDLDQRLGERAAEALKARQSGAVELGPDLRVFLDVLSSDSRLVICGAGHIALSLARFALEAGFAVTVLDDREEYAQGSRFPGCDVIEGEFAATLRQMPLGPTSYAVVITRGHEHDADCLLEILRKPTAYVGLIGSRRRVRFVRELLAREGVPSDRLEDLFTPIGLSIGAESPQEIALSIAAELVSARRLGPEATKRLRRAGRGDE